MDKDQMKNTFDLLNPTKEQSQKMWEQLESKSAFVNRKHERRAVKRFRYAFTVVIAVLAVFISGAFINAATDGRFVMAMKELVGIKQSRQDVAGQAEDIQKRGIEVWAPEIFNIDDNYVIFGTLRGILVYDWKQAKLQGTIDTQAVGCIYLNSDEKRTHIVKDGDDLVLFNSDNGIPFGDYYKYSLENSADLEIPVSEQGEDQAELNKYYKLWETAEKNYVDTFEMFAENASFENLLENKEVMYSRRCIGWTDSEGNAHYSFLVVEQSQYFLYHYEEESDTFADVGITIDAEQEGQMPADGEVELPLFCYSGDDMAVKAICEYFSEEEQDNYAEDGAVFIPGFIIYEEVEEQDEYLVFGNFWFYGYQLNGNILEVSSGGEMPACFHLKKTDAGYEVLYVEKAGDGEDYSKDIEEFTKNYPGLYEKYQGDDNDCTEAMKKYLQMYVRDNNLDIQYFKEYGWEPVAIFE